MKTLKFVMTIGAGAVAGYLARPLLEPHLKSLLSKLENKPKALPPGTMTTGDASLNKNAVTLS